MPPAGKWAGCVKVPSAMAAFHFSGLTFRPCRPESTPAFWTSARTGATAGNLPITSIYNRFGSEGWDLPVRLSRELPRHQNVQQAIDQRQI